MFCSNEIMHTLQNENFSFKKFIEEVKIWNSYSHSSKTANSKAFLDTLILPNENMKKIHSIDEISEINFKLLSESMVESQKRRIKWKESEKTILVWVVFYYAQIRQKSIEKMVCNFTRNNPIILIRIKKIGKK